MLGTESGRSARLYCVNKRLHFDVSCALQPFKVTPQSTTSSCAFRAAWGVHILIAFYNDTAAVGTFRCPHCSIPLSATGVDHQLMGALDYVFMRKVQEHVVRTYAKVFVHLRIKNTSYCIAINARQR